MNDYKDTSHSIKELLKKAANILIISHQKPDGDTLGANLAMTDYLLSQNKKVTSFCLDPLPATFDFLPQSHLMTDDHLVFTQQYDLVIVLDSGSLAYAGIDKLLTALPGDFTLINIDHHASNPGYGDINLVIATAASTTEIIYRLFKDWSIKWTPGLATALICGLITDTGGFMNPATNYSTLTAAADLINHGANVNQISQITLSNQSIDSLKLWGKALSRLTRNPKYDLVYTYLTQADFDACQADESAAEGIANFLHILKEAKIILLLRETDDGLIKGSLRTTDDNIDLAKLAQALGGGGHKKAAGFSLPGRLAYDNNKLKVI
jgi:bifunctional oligoribonuclease and PAP phosphatase NrnA